MEAVPAEIEAAGMDFELDSLSSSSAEEEDKEDEDDITDMTHNAHAADGNAHVTDNDTPQMATKSAAGGSAAHSADQAQVLLMSNIASKICQCL